MAAFVNLEDSPMFQKQVCSLEQVANELKDRCERLYKGCHLFMEALGEACNADNTFADSLEAFGGGQDDPVSVTIGGPVISKFINAFRELATYKEFLRSQVEHVLIDRLTHFVDVDLQDAKESRRLFDKAAHVYDQSREKFVSLKKNTREDIVEELEEDLKNSKSAFERSRFNLVSALTNIEAKKKYEFLDSISAVMDAHLRYFKLGYELFSQIEPYIHQVLAYAQQSREQATVEQDKLAKRIQEFRTQVELDSIQASYLEPSTSEDGMHSDKSIEAVTQTYAKGEVQTVKQGYLLKRSSSLRGDWKRRFFVLNSQGSLYYYRNKGTRSMGIQHHSTMSGENNNGVFSRFRSKHSRSLSLGEGSLDCQVVDLHTSKLKMDAENTDLRLCFRIITPIRTYTLQAENEADRMDWVNKVTGAIASLLNSHIFQQPYHGVKHLETFESTGGVLSDVQHIDYRQHVGDYKKDMSDGALGVVRKIPGNDLCAECSTPKPDWASLNLGILLCIECSGVHRNLGVHISKVRSLTLDVKVWEPTILDLFHALGNAYCNSVWEGLLQMTNERMAESNIIVPPITKPCPKDAINEKEKYIQAKYVQKLLVIKEPSASGACQAQSIWEAVKENNLREVYRLIAISDTNICNSTFSDASGNNMHDHIKHQEQSELNSPAAENNPFDPVACPRIKDSNDPENCLLGCSLLHLACHGGNMVMVELLLQFGADGNHRDFHGRTPLHHCISRRNYPLAKFLLRRGASASIKDGGGLTVLERAMEMGAITDEELFIMLSEC